MIQISRQSRWAMAPMVCLCPQARHQTAINDLEDASFNLNRGIGRLIENPPHVAIALRRAVALGHAPAFFISGACTNPRGELLGGRKRRCHRTHFGHDLLG